MFTGLITHIGIVSKTKFSSTQDNFLRINIKWQYKSLLIGSSVCCNGVCLTVIGKTNEYFDVMFSKETSSKTNYSNIKVNDKINLERSLKVGQEMGGHMVTGHVDGTAKLMKLNKIKSSYELWFETNSEIINFLAEKGSIALNGISLTVNRIIDKRFSVNIIQLTWNKTNLSFCKLGDQVNLEIDIISRYVNSHLKLKELS